MNVAKCLALGVGCAIAAATLAQTPAVSQNFVENKGQWDSHAKFLTRMPGLNLWVTDNGAVLDFYQFTRTNKANLNPKYDHPKGVVRGHVIQMAFVGGQTSTPSGQYQASGVFNFLSDRGSIAHVRQFGQVQTSEVYPGISARYSFDHGAPRYDLVVQPGADPSQIGIKFEGADGLSIGGDGNLQVETSVGTVEEKGLTVYQDSPSGTFPGFQDSTVPGEKGLEGLEGSEEAPLAAPGARPEIGTHPDAAGTVARPGPPPAAGAGETPAHPGLQIIPSKMVLDGNILRFKIGDYDHTKPLVIDPVIYSSYLGGVGNEAPGDTAIAVTPSFSYNGSNYQYIAGNSDLPGFPTTLGSYQDTYQGGNQGFVAQIQSATGTMTWCSYIQGASSDANPPECNVLCALADSSGNAIIGGQMTNEGYAETFGAYQSPDQNTAHWGGFIIKVSANGVALMDGSSFSANGDTAINAMAQDGNGDILFTGSTAASDYPITAGAFQGTNNALQGPTAFVSVLSADFTTLLGSTYIGGTGEDIATGVASNPLDGGVMIAGYTSSIDFPVSGGALMSTSMANGAYTGFIAEVTSGGGGEVNGTFFGGSDQDQIYAMYVDPASNDVVVAGATSSTDLFGAGFFQGTLKGQQNGFVAYIEDGLNYLDSCSYFGGSKTDSINAIYPDPSHGPFIAGTSTSPDLPVSTGSYQPTGGNTNTAFFAEMGGLSTLQYGTFYGSNTSAVGIAPDSSGNIVFAGTAGTVPTTFGATQTFNGGSGGATNAFYADVSPQPETLSLSLPASPITGTETIYGTLSLSSVANEPYAQVTLASDNPIAIVQSALRVTAGGNAISFPISCKPASVDTAVHITAAYNGVQTTATINLTPYPIKSIVFSPSTVVGGNTATGTITLAGLAGPGPMTVILHSGSGAVTVPATMQIAAGQTTGTFTATSHPVNVLTGLNVSGDNTKNAINGAVYVSPPFVSKISFSPAAVAGGSTSTGTVTLYGNAGPSGAVVKLSSNNAAAATVPASITVPAGTNTATFSVTTNPVSAATSVQITGTFNGVPENSSLSVTAPALSSLTLSSSSVTGGNPATATVTLSSVAASSGVTLSLSSANTSLATVPASVKVGPGQTKASFTVTTDQVLSSSSTTITATMGTVQKTATISLAPIQLSALSLRPIVVTGGASAIGTVTLSAPEGSSPIFVSLSSNDTSAASPQYTVLDFGTAGQSTLEFNVFTNPVATPALVTITASYNGVSMTQQLTVNPAALSAVSVSPSSVVGGNSVTGTITLTGPAGPSAFVVNLSSGSSSAKVPATITIPVGKTSATFTITTSAVSASTAVMITAKWNTLTKTCTLMLTP